YSLSSPLFSDYSDKLRFVYIPEGKKLGYEKNKVFLFPVGSILIKTFAYLNTNGSLNPQLLETRLLIHANSGWKTISYIWNKEQTEAYLEIAGKTTEVSFINKEGEKITFDYSVPTQIQCKGCHLKNDKISPIGPSIRQLNKDFDYAQGIQNQLIHWEKAKILSSLPDISKIPQLPVWDDETTGSLHERAMAYLDINCGHCHREEGPANTSGLRLRYNEIDPYKIGIMKKPVAAGKGTGGRPYDIVPGQPDQSILIYRMESTDPGKMMPEVGRKIVHKEGVEMIRDWISHLK
ncbi:MAG TPA: hypothetical protein EYQ86_03130, partial [Bacteroidetes bacterium]|nr:hypothetical protein [Bacteroidota bacterium]